MLRSAGAESSRARNAQIALVNRKQGNGDMMTAATQAQVEGYNVYAHRLNDLPSVTINFQDAQGNFPFVVGMDAPPK